MHKLLLNLLALSLLFASCQESEHIVRYTVASQRGDCHVFVPAKCLLVKPQGEQSWQNFYEGIGGFDYEPGYEYVVDVRLEDIPNPPMDGSSVKYTLVKVLSKVEKESENLPLPRE